MIAIGLLLFLASGGVERLTHEVAESGRVLQIATSESERATPPPAIAPGMTPLLAFRYLEGKARHRYGELDLVIDDAGH